MSVMNRYGQVAMRHWRQWLPQTTAGIPDQTAFFSDLGQQAAAEIDQLADRLAGPSRPQESYLERLGRLREARMSAESAVLRERILLAPETSASGQTASNEPATSLPGTDPQTVATVMSQPAPWTPVTQDLSDPVWQTNLRYLAETTQSEQPSTETGTSATPTHGNQP
jgi:hypothetical protein